jgi:uncharacterized membrane protein YdjX (TVP38/TMEM64 family)
MQKLWSNKTYTRLSVFIVFVLSLIFLGKIFSIKKEQVETLLEKIPLVYSSLVFIILYVASNFFISGDPKEVLKLVSALIFGPYLSTGLIYIAEIINASIFFSLSKFFGQSFAEKYLKGRFKKIYERLGNLSFTWVALLRLNLLIPYRLLDVCFGLSKSRFKKYISAVLLASPPRIFFLQFLVAGVGQFSFEKMKNYFQTHPVFNFLSAAYFVFSIIVILKSKRKLWPSE